MIRSSQGLVWPAVLSVCMAVSACNPALNWRRVSFDDQPEPLLLPCKPDVAERQVDLGGIQARLRMMGCEAQDLHFTWSRLDLPAGSNSAQVIKAWQQASLLAMGADPALASGIRAWALSGARADPPPSQLQAASATGHQAHFSWWMRGQQAHQLAVYSARHPVAPAIIQTLQEGVQQP